MLIIFGIGAVLGPAGFGDDRCAPPGTVRSIVRTRASCREVSLTEMPGGSMMLIHSDPSFSSGRNSLPSRGTSARLAASAATAAARTKHAMLERPASGPAGSARLQSRTRAFSS